MAHMLATSADGTFSFAFKGAKTDIWHREGQPVPADATVAQMIDPAGWNFTVKQAFVRYATGRGMGAEDFQTDADHVVLFHSRTLKPLGVVSDSFQRVQPYDGADLLERLISTLDLPASAIDTMGVTHDGAGLFANIVAGDAMRIVGADTVRPNFLFTTRNDGTAKTRIKNCFTRAVCNNTVQAALGEGKHALDLTLSHRSEFNPAKIAAQYALYVAEWKATAEKFRMLAQTPVSMATADVLIYDTFNARRTDAAKADPKRDIRNGVGYKTILGLFAGAGRGASLPGVKGTAWGLFNGFTEYLEHHATARSVSQRFDSNLDGTASEIKSQAFERLMALATAE